jgi:hypothetical protein
MDRLAWWKQSQKQNKQVQGLHICSDGGWSSVKPARLHNGYFRVPRRDMRKVFFRAPTSGQPPPREA